MPKIKVDKGYIYYEEYGNGAPLLLIAGLASDISSWLPVIIPLSKKYRLLVFDNRGVGRSSHNNNGIDIEQMTNDALSLFNHLGLTKVHVLGHSMGGMIAMKLAAKFPSKVDKLVLAATSPVISKRNILLFSDMAKLAEICTDRELWFRFLFYWIFSPKFFNDKKFVDQAVAMAVNYRYLQSFDSFKNQVEAIINYNGEGEIKSIESQTLILKAYDDLLFPVSDSEEVFNDIPNQKEVIIKNAGHSVYMDATDEFLNYVFDFIS